MDWDSNYKNARRKHSNDNRNTSTNRETNKTQTETREINIETNKNRIINEPDFCPIKLRFISLVHLVVCTFRFSVKQTNRCSNKKMLYFVFQYDTTKIKQHNFVSLKLNMKEKKCFSPVDLIHSCSLCLSYWCLICCCYFSIKFDFFYSISILSQSPRIWIISLFYLHFNWPIIFVVHSDISNGLYCNANKLN